MPTTLTATLLALSLSLPPLAAQAEMIWAFSYDAAGISVNGDLTTADSAVNGAWQVTGVSGTRNGQAILGLVSTHASVPGLSWDNLLYGSGAAFDSAGLMFDTAGGDFNLCSGSRNVPTVSCGDGGYHEYNGQNDSTPSVNLTLKNIPEPSTTRLLAAALGGLALMRRRRPATRLG